MGTRPKVQTPARIGRYEIIDKLATGGMAELYLARFDGPGGFEKRCALKRILPQFAADEAFRRMFVNEARVTAMFDHPNLVQIFELGEDEAGQFYIAMELVRGLNVRQIIRLARDRDTTIPAEIAAFTAIQALDGLAYAHGFVHPDTREPLGLVHRDISPQNILISYSGAVKLVDFGIVKSSFIGGETQAGMLKGKVTYMSPEQAAGDPIDCRSDVFSLGICLYEMVTGMRPFWGRNELMVLKAIFEDPAPPLTMHAPDCPEGVEQAIERALAKNPAHRFPDARSFQTELQEILQKTPHPVTRHTLSDYVRSLESNPDTFDATQVKIPRRHSATHRLSRASYPAPGAAAKYTPISSATPGDVRPGQLSERLTPRPLNELSSPSEIIPATGFGPKRSYAGTVMLFGLSAIVGAAVVWSFFYFKKQADAVVVEPVDPPVFDIRAEAAPSEPPGIPEAQMPSSVSIPLPSPKVPPTKTSEAPSAAAAPAPSYVPRRSSRPARSPRGRLMLDSSPPGLSVMRGKRELGVTPLETRLPVGHHTLRLVDPKQGINRKLTVEIGRDGTTSERVDIARGTLKVLSRPWAEVYLNGVHQGKTPLSIEAYAGTHTLRLVSPEAGERTRRVALLPGAEKIVPVKF